MANQADKLLPTAAFHLERLLQAAAVTLQVCLLVREFEVAFKFLLQVGLFLFVGPLSLFYLVSLCFTDYYLIPTCYLCWYLWDIPSSTNGGRSGPLVNWVRWILILEKFNFWSGHSFNVRMLQVMADLEVECFVLPCRVGQDCRTGPKEEPPDQLPSPWNPLLWCRGSWFCSSFFRSIIHFSNRRPLPRIRVDFRASSLAL